jgi:hypothetical protein
MHLGMHHTVSVTPMPPNFLLPTNNAGTSRNLYRSACVDHPQQPSPKTSDWSLRGEDDNKLSTPPADLIFVALVPPPPPPPAPATTAAANATPIIILVTQSPSLMQAREDQSDAKTSALQMGRPSERLVRWGKAGVFHENSIQQATTRSSPLSSCWARTRLHPIHRTAVA